MVPEEAAEGEEEEVDMCQEQKESIVRVVGMDQLEGMDQLVDMHLAWHTQLAGTGTPLAFGFLGSSFLAWIDLIISDI